MEAVQVAKDVFWVGALDWNGRSFHGYNTPRGTSYNAYLILGEKNILIDSVKYPFYDQLLERVSSVIDPRKIDLIISNHTEPDHSSSLLKVQQLTGAMILASKKGVEGLTLHYDGIKVEAVQDGQEIRDGERTLRFIETPFLHWPDSMFTYLVEEGILFCMDAFGQHLCSSRRFDDEVDEGILLDEAAKYYANIILPFGNQVLRTYDKIKGLDLRMLATAHGIIWRSKIDKIVPKYLRWANYETREKVIIVYDTMWNSTKIMAEEMAEAIASRGVEVKLHRITCTDRATIMEDVLEAGAVVVGTPTLNTYVFPTVADIVSYMRGLRPKNRIGAVFGSYGWGGGACKVVHENLEAAGMTMPFADLEVRYVPNAQNRQRCRELGVEIAERVKADHAGTDAPK
jgi:anaerobic nitric oxide reductase flavorubredoxin